MLPGEEDEIFESNKGALSSILGAILGNIVGAPLNNHDLKDINSYLVEKAFNTVIG
jgi:ADP-ribosylglycohydrolase